MSTMRRRLGRSRSPPRSCESRNGAGSFQPTQNTDSIAERCARFSICDGSQIQRWYFRLPIRLDGSRFPEPILHRERIRRSTVLLIPLTSPASSSASRPYRATWSSQDSASTAESKPTVLGMFDQASADLELIFPPASLAFSWNGKPQSAPLHLNFQSATPFFLLSIFKLSSDNVLI